MAIKDFILKDSYSRIERVDLSKQIKTVDFYLTVYADNSCQSILAQNIRFTAKNDFLNSISDYDTFFEKELKTEKNILQVCYEQLSKRPEFINTSEA